jgi:hypothetical protein
VTLHIAQDLPSNCPITDYLRDELVALGSSISSSLMLDDKGPRTDGAAIEAAGQRFALALIGQLASHPELAHCPFVGLMAELVSKLAPVFLTPRPGPRQPDA